MSLSQIVFGERPADSLPQVVQETLVRRQVQSETLIAVVQCVLVVFFAGLYAAAAKPVQVSDFMPVPWVLAAYGAVVVGHLMMIRRVGAPLWLSVASAVVNVSLLMVLIWSFHIQYQQPPAFYLKAPTLLYVFIFIALRALRFDPRPVVAAGLTAAAGWAILLWYAQLDADSMMDMVTRDYVEYMTSTKVLIGAELDKIVSILLVTGVLAVALVRARRTLIRAIHDSAQARELTRFVAPEVADRIRSADRPMRPGDGEVKEATVMFTDIEAYSSLSEGMAPDVLAQTLNDYFAAMDEVVEAAGGMINNFEGDAMLVTFNTARPDDAHARGAVDAALAIQRVVAGRRFGPEGAELKTRCGINTGAVVCGAVGTEDRLLFTVHGDDVNIAARLEPLNKEFGTYILAAETTVAAAGDGFVFRKRGDITVRGRAQPTKVFSVEAG